MCLCLMFTAPGCAPSPGHGSIPPQQQRPQLVPTFSFWNPLVDGLTTSRKLGQGLGGRLPAPVTARHPPPFCPPRHVPRRSCGPI